MLKKFLLLVILSFSFLTNAQTLYWVGGSGNITDGNHWSLTSGGIPVGIVPSNKTDLIFDDQSGSRDLVINLVGLIHVKSLEFKNTNNDYHLVGNSLSVVNCSGDFILNSRTYFDASSKLIFSKLSQNYSVIDFSRNKLNSDVLFEEGNWNIRVLKVADANTLTFLKGTYNINNCLLVAGNLTANTGQVIFNVFKSPFKITNKLLIGDNASFNSTDFILIANKNNNQLYKVDPTVTFGQNSRIVNPNPQACLVTTSFTNSPCGNVCGAVFSINFDPSCTNGPYDIIFSTSAPCIPPGANGVSPPGLVFSNLCNNCAGYQVDGVVFDNLGNIETTFSGNTQQIVSPISISYVAIARPTCFGSCDGSIRYFLNSGQQPYNVAIDPTATPAGPTFTNVPPIITQTLTGLCAGVHTFVVTDNNGCIQTFTQTINAIPQILPNGVSNNITCNGACNGSAVLTPTGGNAGGYTYSWNPSSSTTATISSLCAGNVSVTVRDSKNCTGTYSATITQPPAITLTVTKTNLTCGALCDGTASVTATGGTGSFTYAWVPSGPTGTSATGLCTGNYTVNVIDALNCTRSVTFQITAPPTLTASPTQTNVSCNGLCDASINLNASGGNPGYAYSWSPSISTISTATAVCPGVYSYTVTDTQLCKYSSTVSITQPPSITLTVTNTNITCFGSCNGRATAGISGGTSPFTYTWSPGVPSGQGTGTITALCINNYTVAIRDANGCSATGSTTITQPLDITINTTTVYPSCNGLCNGSVTASPTGGTGPYTYTLQPSVGAPMTGGIPFIGLCAGNYTLLVKDAMGCTKTQTINLTQPNAVTLALNSTTISCFNQCNATISSVVGGGTPSYSFTWSNGSNATTLSGQCTGVYTATVSDGNGCKATASVNVTSPTDMTVSITPTNPNCNAQCTGIASATVSGGTPNYAINWNTGTVGNTASGLCQGSYTATVTDFLGCVKTQTVAIITPSALTLTPTSGTVSCAGACNGTVSVLPSGGTAGYFVSWNSVPPQSTASATGLCAGNYIANVTDSKGCAASIGASITQPTALTSTLSNLVPSCNVCIGAATANGLGGTAPYTYSWAPSGQTTSTANNLCAGVQTLVVTDSRNCTSTSTLQIIQTVIVILTSNGSTLSCNGSCSGVASANASGGLAPYSYTWSPAPIQNLQTATGLCAGIHTVQVTDANGCFSNGTVSFVSPPAITLTVTKTDVTCNSSCNGVATATASGGTGALTYLWQPGGFTTPSISNLCPGDYTVTISDINSCTQSQVVTITQSNSLTATFTNVDPTGCSTSDGSISFVPAGGVTPYTFTWTPGGNANPLINLTDGVYVLQLRDNNGCSISFTTTLSDPIGATVTAVTNSITCFGQCTGSSTISITGNGPFSVNWPSIPSTNTVVTNLCAGNYVTQVIDNNGCVTNQNISILQPTQISSSGVTTNVMCNSVCAASINITPTGGTIPYAFSWSPAGGNVEDPTGLCAGNYSVDITDANSCLVTNTFAITQPSTLTLSFNKKDVVCQGGCTGSVRAIVSGGTAPYTYNWTPLGSFAGSTIDTIVNLCTGIYQVTVFDINGCSISASINIGEPTALTSTLTSVNVKCNGQCNGKAIITPSGGTLPYSFSYNTSPILTTQTVTTLCPGSYIGMVIDGNGCSNTHAFTISQPLPITVTVTPTNPKCNAVCNGSISTTVSGGSGSYSYNWIPSGGPVQNPYGLCNGNYQVIVTDDSLCTGTALVTLTDPPALIANISYTNPICSGGCNGVATTNPIGGTAPYTYLWSSPTNTTQTITGLCAGDYTLQLTDANLCQDIQVASLLAPSAVSINPAVTPALCGTNTGSITANAFNGTAPYTFNWLPPVSGAQSTNTTVIGLSSGLYTVTVTDANSCSTTVFIPLSNSNGPSGVTLTYTDVACKGQCNGAAEISSPVRGASPYILSWSVPSSTTALISNLCTGSYIGLVTDANNCLFFQSAPISEPQLIDDNDNISSAICSGNCNGIIALNPTGGNGGYTYLWSDASTTQSVSNLCPGSYSVTITDSKGCTLTTSYSMPSLITITSSIFATDNTCFSDCNGSLLATNIAGGIPPYSFNWSDALGQSNATAIGLCNGNYSVTVTDASGCFDKIPGVVTSPSQVTFTTAVTQPGCGLCDGVAVITPTGGTPSYSIVWSNTQTGTTASNLCAGVYDIQITDGSGCVSTSNVIINSLSTITGETITSANEFCFSVCDGSVSVTAIGGTMPITYYWIHDGSTSQNLTGLCSGTYFCNMTDANGCLKTASVVIGAAASLSITSFVTQSSCTSSTGSITVSVTGGNGIYNYSWLPAGNTATVTNLAPDSYTLTVSDGNGCSATQNYAIGTINGPSITFSQKDISCGSVCDGSIAINITGGSPGYTTLWSNSASTTTLTNLCTGAYSVRVTDMMGCAAVQNFSLTSLPPLVFSSPNITSPTCYNDCDGALVAIPSGGSLPYTYSWSPMGTSATNITNLCSGTYSVSVTDVNGCNTSNTYTLINPTLLTLSSIVTDASCNNTMDGTVDITVSGGFPVYTYSWTNNATSEDITNVQSGTYSLTLLDNNGCRKDTAFTINAGITVNSIVGRDTTFCQNSSFILDGSTSNGGVTYQWVLLPTNTVVSNTTIATINPSAGTNTYVLIATNGICVDRDSIVITSNALPAVDAGPFVNIPFLTTSPIGGSPTGPPGSSISWSPSLPLDNPITSNPIASNTVTTNYTVTVVDVNGCSNYDTVTVYIYPEIKIPNGFSPNADGKNDTWMVDLIHLFPDCEVEVYNRWGEQLFYSKGYSAPWNGYYKGKELPVGTYYYIINLNHPAYPDAYTGPLTIFR